MRKLYKKIYKALEKTASFMVGSIFAVLTWDAWLAALLTDGWLRMLFLALALGGLAMTMYWALVPRAVDRRLSLRKRKAARRVGTR